MSESNEDFAGRMRRQRGMPPLPRVQPSSGIPGAPVGFIRHPGDPAFMYNPVTGVVMPAPAHSRPPPGKTISDE